MLSNYITANSSGKWVKIFEESCRNDEFYYTQRLTWQTRSTEKKGLWGAGKKNSLGFLITQEPAGMPLQSHLQQTLQHLSGQAPTPFYGIVIISFHLKRTLQTLTN